MHPAAFVLCALSAAATEPFRPPAVPLAVATPYLSAWSRSDRLTDSWSTHWSGTAMGMSGMIMVDGKAYRWCGPAPADVPAAEQRSVEVDALSTTYRFTAGGVELEVAFVTPSIPASPAYVSWAGTLVYCGVHAPADGPGRTVSVYLDLSGEWCTHVPSQPVTWSRLRGEGCHVLGMGVEGGKVLGRAGDHTRLDWGRVHLAARDTFGVTTLIAPQAVSRSMFATGGLLAGADDLDHPRPADEGWPVLAAARQFGRIESGAASETVFVIAQDERRNVEYFERPLRPYWTVQGPSFGATITEMLRDDTEIVREVKAENRRLRTRASEAGGDRYADLCELAWRQVMAAHSTAAELDGSLLMFPKENSSNGCIGTVDVIFPASPLFLEENPAMLEAQVRPILEYAAMPGRWPFPFAPHDLGVHPRANGQVYGGGERSEADQMPVEESANMLILVEALRQARGGRGGGERLARLHFTTLTKWAAYLEEFGLDPADQLCTDDFAGHLARNANLSIKAVIALGAYANLCEAVGTADQAAKWRELARSYAAKWMELAADGDRTVLAFGKPGSWSLKYNLVWDRILGLDLFPAALAEREVAWYFERMNRFGPPLDSRDTYTKLDFVAWCGAMCATKEQFERFISPVHDFAQQTPDRVPLSDWYRTTDGRSMGMHSRSVVGGLWARQLLDGRWKRRPE
ncbi:MAG: DUF4965 domain-containing protein [Phycisphaerae bacterium]